MSVNVYLFNDVFPNAQLTVVQYQMTG